MNNTLTSLKQYDHDVTFGYCDYTDDGRPFYVGIGNLRRLRRPTRNVKHTNVRKKYGFLRVVEFMASGSLAWHEACAWEVATINHLDTLHCENSVGCNFTIGGDGIKGFFRKKTLEERKKISISKKKQYEDPQARHKLGQAIALAKQDPEKYQNHCLGQQKRYSNHSERQKAHESNTQKKRVQQLTLKDEVIAEYPSMSYAMQATGVKNIKLVCQGKRPRAGGYKWRYMS